MNDHCAHTRQQKKIEKEEEEEKKRIINGSVEYEYPGNDHIP